ncbi:MAG: hypothetical protein COC01_03165 [Bacteroidetes bacterium]|nr:T9SS type A sorting domain-containing protein [Bacteroidia bacterium]PCH68663.1 MAG: hypothetical protein COC01_03165 [Bacteroidota bacterium]
MRSTFTIFTILVFHNNVLSIDLGNDTTICKGDTIILDAGVDSASYFWSDSSTTSTIQVSKSGIYFVQVTDSLTITDTISISIDTIPKANFSVKDSGLTNYFTNLSTSNSTSYLWNFGDGFSDTTINPIHYYDSCGYFNIKLYAINKCGNDTFIKLIEVKDFPDSGYIPFPDSNAIWFEQYYLSCGSGGVPLGWYEECDIIGINGDTIIDSKIYNKLYEVRDSNLYFINARYIGAIRENCSKQIFYFPKHANKETILFDFDISINDTVAYSFKDSTPSYEWFGDTFIVSFYVDSITSKLLIDGYHKVWNTNMLYSTAYIDNYGGKYNTMDWIEGIGSSAGLLYYRQHLNLPEGKSTTCVSEKTLVYYMHNGETLYESDYLSVCQDYDRVNEIAYNVNPIIVSPNPFSNATTFHFDHSNNGEFDLRVYDTTGKLLRSESGINYKSFVFYRENLSSGIYFYKISGKKQIYNGKLIIE